MRANGGAGERSLLVTVALGAVLAPLNSSMIVVALPRIGQAFGATESAVAWLVTVYLIAMALLQPVAGKVGDHLGRRRLMLGGFLYFGLASLGAAASSSFLLLLFFRVQQAVAGALVLPNAIALIRQVVPEQRRGERFGLIGSAIALAVAVGPPLGGLLVEALGWRAIFAANLLLILPALIVGRRAIPAGRAEVHGGIPFDLLRLFRNRAFAAANGAIAASNLAMYSTLVALPLMLSRMPGWRDAKIGFVLAALSATMMVTAPLGGRLADRWGRRWPTVAGLALFTLGLLGLACIWRTETVSFATLATGLGVAGAGLGVSGAGLQTAVVEALSVQEAGVAAGIFATSRYAGSIVGTGLLATTLDLSGGNAGWLFVMLVAAATLATLTSLGLKDRPAADGQPATA